MYWLKCRPASANIEVNVHLLVVNVLFFLSECCSAFDKQPQAEHNHEKNIIHSWVHICLDIHRVEAKI